MTEFEGQSVLVLGLGVSGLSATKYLVERGARVVAADESDSALVPRDWSSFAR